MICSLLDFVEYVRVRFCLMCDYKCKCVLSSKQVKSSDKQEEKEAS